MLIISSYKSIINKNLKHIFKERSYSVRALCVKKKTRTPWFWTKQKSYVNEAWSVLPKRLAHGENQVIISKQKSQINKKEKMK